ncbi:CD151 antigen-like isoform X2 [Ptychodera flava]
MGGKTQVKVKRKLGCGAKCLKFLLCFFNIIFLLAGAAVLGVGVWILVSANSVAAIFGSQLLVQSSYVLMVAGAIAIIMAFIGCCGAWKENKCLLMTYFIALLLIFIAELVGGILAYAYRNEGKDAAKKTMRDTCKNKYGLPNEDDVTKQWDAVQEDFECCGVEGDSTDAYGLWAFSEWHKNSADLTHLVPPSCCKRVDGEVQNLDACQRLLPLPTNPAYVNTEGCFDKVYKTVVDNAVVIGGVGVGIAFVQIFGMLFAICLFRQL